jgi:hypothetical protein
MTPEDRAELAQNLTERILVWKTLSLPVCWYELEDILRGIVTLASEAPKTPHQCPICNGTGSVRADGIVATKPCPVCLGARILWG